MGTMIDERVETERVLSTDKPESAHIVLVPEGEPDETPQAYVLRARIEGFPVTALCGYTWVPSKNPGNLPVCQECVDIYEMIGLGSQHGDEFKDLPDA